MKRSFAYLMAAAAVSLALCGCGSMTGNGNVGASPAPTIETPVIPSPDIDLNVSPLPGDRDDAADKNNSGLTEKDNSAADGVTNAGRGSTVSPKPSAAAK